MNRKAYYPETDVKVTGPTFWVECMHCGYKRIHLLKKKKCPACSEEVVCRTLTEVNEREDI